MLKGSGKMTMPRPRKAQKNSPVRLTEQAIAEARIASGYTGETMADYCSRIIVERAKIDIEDYHARRIAAEKKPKGG